MSSDLKFIVPKQLLVNIKAKACAITDEHSLTMTIELGGELETFRVESEYINDKTFYNGIIVDEDFHPHVKLVAYATGLSRRILDLSKRLTCAGISNGFMGKDDKNDVTSCLVYGNTPDGLNRQLVYITVDEAQIYHNDLDVFPYEEPVLNEVYYSNRE